MTNSPLTKPYPSDPTKRYRQARVGDRNQGTTQNSVWTYTADGTGGNVILTVTDQFGRNIILTDAEPSPLDPLILPDYNATAATVQGLIEAKVGAGNVTVTGGVGASGGGTPYVITFVGELAGEDIRMTGASLLSGGGATLTLTHTTEGGRPNASVPTGPALSTNTPVPANSIRGREGEAGFVDYGPGV